MGATSFPVNPRFDSLSQEQQDRLTEWRDAVADVLPQQHLGLWVCGPRASGTSYVAWVAMQKVIAKDKLFASYQDVTAQEFMDLTRDEWKWDERVRHHPDDFGLWEEHQVLLTQLTDLWTCGVLWVDDMHHKDIDLKFWQKHVQSRIEARIKKGLPTVVSTTMMPDSRMMPAGVIQERFIVVLCPPRHATSDDDDAGR